MNDSDEHDWAAEVRDAYRRPVVDEGAARSRLSERLARVPPPRAGLLAWWLAPGALELRPVWAMLLLLATALAGAWIGRAMTPPVALAPAGPAPSPVAAAAGTPVAFVLEAPGASSVSLVGDFNGWDRRATPLRHDAAGARWAAEVALDPGLHTYAFVIDDRVWSVDPSAPLSAETAYGRRHSVVLVEPGGVL